MQIRSHQRLHVDVEITRIGAVFGGEEHQARTGVPVRRVAATGNQLHAAHAVEQTEVGDILQRVLQIGRGGGVVDAFELVGGLKGEAAANRDRPRLVDRNAGNTAQQRVLIGVETLALHHVDLRAGYRVGVDRHAALKGTPGRTRVRRSDHFERPRERDVDGLLRAVEHDHRNRIRGIPALDERERVRIGQNAQETIRAVGVGRRAIGRTGRLRDHRYPCHRYASLVVGYPSRNDSGGLRERARARGGKAKKAEEQDALFYAAEAVEQTVLPIATQESACADSSNPMLEDGKPAVHPGTRGDS